MILPERPLLVVNPVAGPWWRRRELPGLLESFRRRFPRGKILETSLSEPALSREAIPAGTDLLVVKGGDGTVHRIVQRPLPSGLPILVLPGGTGNVLARFLGVPPAPEEIWNQLPNSRICRIRPGRVGQRLFLIMAGIGWDGHAADIVSGKWLLGPVAYYMAGLRALLSPGLPRFSVRITTSTGGQKSFDNVLWCLASRLPPYIGPFSVQTRETPDQDTLTVTLISGSRLGIPLAFASFLPGVPPLLSGTQFQAHSLAIFSHVEHSRASASAEIPIQADGESVPFSPTISVSCDSLPFLYYPPG
jgi:diacylglycerol kinase family enzyme